MLKPQLLVAIVLIGCHNHRSNPPYPPITGFRFGAYATVQGVRDDTLRISGTAENVSNHVLMVEWGSCNRLHPLIVDVKRGRASWNSRAFEVQRARKSVRYDASGREIPTFCGGVEFVQGIAPGKLLRFAFLVPINDILGDSLPPGNYKITARVDINGQTSPKLVAGQVRLGR